MMLVALINSAKILNGGKCIMTKLQALVAIVGCVLAVRSVDACLA